MHRWNYKIYSYLANTAATAVPGYRHLYYYYTSTSVGVAPGLRWSTYRVPDTGLMTRDGHPLVGVRIIRRARGDARLAGLLARLLWVKYIQN